MKRKPATLLVNSQSRPQTLLKTVQCVLNNDQDVQIIPVNNEALAKTKEVLTACEFESKKITKEGLKGYYISCH